MAVAGGPRLLAAAWIFAAAAASLPLEQAGRSQKSINCMPCSRTYIGDAYLHTLTDHAHHRGLAEMSDSDELCEGLTDDVEVPTLSELQRQLLKSSRMGCLLTHLSYSILLSAKFSLMLLFLETPTLNYPQLYPTGQPSRFILISGQAL
ncbi:hypothetical protein SETIT_3G375000v2 [Setaria italica]|uniref:C2H2-type domain-containing protein n=1 Tax=Setaria italica TaxID=4555 RepID=A0A368QN08_SETIT|nr:hypothetical protein SETIT_3G375000v2 [Setaria italica]RCV19330.1 hypothetical protein SETIT_3G375000v2 [Setaria italica]RCV19331.1 hypothetical protein SETIT_3G375000v2 [Setaria italica]